MTITLRIAVANGGESTIQVSHTERDADPPQLHVTASAWATGQRNLTRALTPPETDQLYRALRSARIAPILDGIAGLDGTTYTLTIENVSQSMDLSWWQSLPQAWSELKALVQILVKLGSLGTEGVR